ncbi:nucleoside diphosphate kinase regulator [Geminicoccaceae bacterium 1502E]|nr:nucleoside diphosphate kinase regulator [Geminicoccaceae bacterium 1502E]
MSATEISKKPGKAAKRAGKPALIIDEAYHDSLQGLAAGAARQAPDLADRLLEEIERADVRPSAQVPPSVVNIGSSVSFRDEHTGQTRTVTLVFPASADISQGRISLLTPIGVALIGLSEGQQFDWTTRDGETRQLTVLKVEQPARGEAGPAAQA